MTFHFWKAWLSSLLFYSVNGNANSMVSADTVTSNKVMEVTFKYHFLYARYVKYKKINKCSRYSNSQFMSKICIYKACYDKHIYFFCKYILLYIENTQTRPNQTQCGLVSANDWKCSRDQCPSIIWISGQNLKCIRCTHLDLYLFRLFSISNTLKRKIKAMLTRVQSSSKATQFNKNT
jgi:hypothetical protein